MHRRRGSILVVAMVVTFALAASVLVLCRSMRTETLAAANQAAALQVAAIERGAEQYVLGILADQGEDARRLSEDQFNAVPVGDGYFWILRPDYSDAQLPAFGLTEESAKVNVNYSSFDKISRLPIISYTAASSLMDWIDDDSTVERDGAETSYYASLRDFDPYYCKNARLETVEEVLMIRGFTRQMVYGDGTAPPLGQRSGTIGAGNNFISDPALARGLYDLMTIYSAENNTTAGGEQRINVNVDRSSRASMRDRLRKRLRNRLSRSRADQIVDLVGDSRLQDIFTMYYRCRLTPDELDKIADDIASTSDRTLRGLININTAPRDVLLCLDNLESADVDKLIAARPSPDNIQPGQLSWVVNAIGAKAVNLGSQITTRTFQWSADILAASGNGRAFKRCRIVVDLRSGTPQIVYRREITDRGWPMDPQILLALRSGEYGQRQQMRTTLSRGDF
jgi:type II secretory pathway component PulK